MRALSLLIKPASGLCNMRCAYCFYRAELAQSALVRPSIMTRATAGALIGRICAEAEREVRVTFQGGEPTLAGLDFYRDFVKRLAAEKSPRLRVRYAIQTNGLAVDRDWAAFFREHDFLVGLSFDGTTALHDRYRKDAEGKTTSSRVRQTWELLRAHGVETNLLCVVTGRAARGPGAIYRSLRQMGAAYVQFIPCISPEGAEWALTAEDYGGFLIGTFDLWYEDWRRGRYRSIRTFDDYVNLLCGRCPSTCAAEGRCGGYLAVESDGSLYPCDFYVRDDWRLGDIRAASLGEALTSEKAVRFRSERELPAKCLACAYHRACRGGCKNDDLNGTNRFCEAYQRFFCHAMPKLQTVARAERRILNGGMSL